MRKHNDNMRRANTLVLAVGLLVLLAIIATSYVAATHSGRLTATSQQYAAMRDNSVQFLAGSIADEISGDLFVRPVDPADPLNPNFPRRPTPPDAPRYMGDQTDELDNTTGLPVPGGDGRLDYPFNTPAYATGPWTNWPDPVTGLVSSPWPRNPDNDTNPALDQGGVELFSLLGLGVGEGNQPGGPGYGDSRWLAATEPMRLAVDAGLDGSMDTLDDIVIFTHWPHMSNLARPNNGWRVCKDIFNILLDQPPTDGIYEFPNVVTDLAIPHEQWLAAVPQPARFSSITGDAIFDLTDADGDGHANPLDLWWNWLSWDAANLTGYPYAYAALTGGSLNSAPLNFYNLRDLNGDGSLHDPGERPLDEFVGPSPQWPLGTPRWNVGRMLADADGDGFTDAMWFLAPAGIDRSIRQIVAVRIIDNSAMLNVNLATRFVPSNQNNSVGARPYRTKGTTPADLALAGALRPDPAVPSWNVGIFDNPEHWFDAPIIPPPQWPAGTFQFHAHYQESGVTDPVALWERHLQEVGLRDLLNYFGGSRTDLVTLGGGEGPDLFLDEFERLDYWLGVGQAMLASESLYPPTALSYHNFTPYGIPEELELRMFHGNNNPWTYSRLERATQPNSQSPKFGILHGGASQDLAGSSEFLGKLLNADLVRDMRRKVTTYSGARNDVMPPWLWPGRTLLNWDFNNNTVNGELEPHERRQFVADIRKLDLRQSFYLPDGSFDEDVDRDGIVEPRSQFPPGTHDDIYPPEDLNPIDGLPDGDGAIDLRDHYAWLQRRIEQVLMDVQTRTTAPPFQPQEFQSYFGNGANDLKQTTRAVASLAANLFAYRDGDPDGNGPLRDEPLSVDRAVIWADPTVLYSGAQKYGYIGMEAQPFLVEAFVAHVYRYSDLNLALWNHPGLSDDSPAITAGDRIICRDSPKGTIVAVQIANPFDIPVELGSFAVSVFGQELRLDNPLIPGPAVLAPGHARTYYAMKDSVVVSFAGWQEVLYLQMPTQFTDAVNVEPTNAWSTDRAAYDAADPDDGVELVRYVGDGTGTPHTGPVVVDRIDIRPRYDEPTDADYIKFGDEVADADPLGSCTEPGPPLPGETMAEDWVDVINLSEANPPDTHAVFMFWVSRAWEIDLDGNGTVDADELNPRFVFSHRHVERGPLRVTLAPAFNETDPPNQWFVDDTTFRLPPRVDMVDKGTVVYGNVGDPDPKLIRNALDFAMQMLQKDTDFEQVGELYNLWLFGHELEYGNAAPSYQDKTRNTFSEFMWDEIENAGIAPADRARVNRLRITPAGAINPFLGKPQAPWSAPVYVLDPSHATPRLTPGARALEAFVCDGPGAAFPDVNGDGLVNSGDDLSGDGQVDWIDAQLRSLRMAGGFSGRGTSGLININTATLEVMQSIPGWYRLVHELAPNDPNNPFVHVPQAVVRYRDRLGDPTSVEYQNIAGLGTLFDPWPSYADRGIKSFGGAPDFFGPQTSAEAGLRQSRGFASIGELMFLLRSGKAGKDASVVGAKYDPSANPGAFEIINNSSCRADFALVPERAVFEAEMGFVPPSAFLFPLPAGLTGASARVSTDVVQGYRPGPPAVFEPDVVAEDAEEANLLVAGASNLVTTRSDVFTVYFKVRSFRQNPVTGRWDATDPEMIVDDSRYVMLVDRTEVNKPGDKPRIVYLEKLPQ